MANSTISALNAGVNATPAPADLVEIVQSGTNKRTSVALLVGSVSVISGLTSTATKTANYTASSGDLVPCDTSGGAFTVTLPASPPTNSIVGIYFATAGNNLTVGRNSQTIDGNASDLTVTRPGTFLEFVFNGTTWVTVTARGEYNLTSGATCTLNASFNTFDEVFPDAGASGDFTLVLPRAGFYELGFSARVNMRKTGGADVYAIVKLHDGTNYLTGSEVLADLNAASTIVGNTVGTDGIGYLASGSTTIKMWAAWSGDSTPTADVHTLFCDGEGRTRMWYRLVG